MRLSQKALQQINTTQVRLRLAMQFDCTERWISQLIKENQSDGDLTKASALQIIREQTGLTDAEILEEGEVVPAAK
jgi:phage repressor protein C with HTH and peptisase S24 domain